jgi:hypothetical protein
MVTFDEYSHMSCRVRQLWGVHEVSFSCISWSVSRLNSCISVSEDLLCAFELLKPLDGAALRKEMTKAKRKRCVVCLRLQRSPYSRLCVASCKQPNRHVVSHVTEAGSPQNMTVLGQISGFGRFLPKKAHFIPFALPYRLLCSTH